jgi:hypothetical protein
MRSPSSGSGLRHTLAALGWDDMMARVRYLPARLLPLLPLMLSAGWQVVTVAELGESSWLVMYWPGRARALA